MFKITLGREYVLQFINPRDVLMKWYIDTVIIRVALLNWIPGKIYLLFRSSRNISSEVTKYDQGCFCRPTIQRNFYKDRRSFLCRADIFVIRMAIKVCRWCNTRHLNIVRG